MTIPDPVPAHVYDLNAELRIDQVLRARLQGRLQILPAHQSQAIRIGRRTLEVAIVAAALAQEQRTADLRQWSDLAQLAQDASASLKKVLRGLDPGGAPGSLAPEFYAWPLQQTRLSRSPYDEASLVQSTEDATALIRALSVVEALQADAAARKASLPARQNPGEPEQGAFLERLAEGWVYLFARRPGLGRHSENNPFVQFARAAWEDWKGEAPKEESAFVGQLKPIVVALSDGLVRGLVAGPSWL